MYDLWNISDDSRQTQKKRDKNARKSVDAKPRFKRKNDTKNLMFLNKS